MVYFKLNKSSTPFQIHFFKRFFGVYCYNLAHGTFGYHTTYLVYLYEVAYS